MCKQVGCLSDALGGILSQQNMPPPRPSSAMLSDFCKSEYDESSNLIRQVRSEVHTPDSPHSVCTDMDVSNDGMDSDNDGSVIENALMSPGIFPTQMRKSRARTNSSTQNGDCMNKRNSMSCRSLERLSRGPGRVSVWSEVAQIQVPHPFRGAHSSQMICTGCGFKVNFSFIFFLSNNNFCLKKIAVSCSIR